MSISPSSTVASKNVQLPIPGVDAFPLTRSRSSDAPAEALVTWDPLEEGEFDPNSRYPSLVFEGKHLSQYLTDRVNYAIQRWQSLPDNDAAVSEVVRTKDTVLASIVRAHESVLRPGMDRSHLAHATALCANAIRTITVLANYIINWQDMGRAQGPFEMVPYFCGMRCYHESQLPKAMLPFGGNKKLVAIKRESLGGDDPRLISNMFASSSENVDRDYQKLLERLRGPAQAARMMPGDDGDADVEAIATSASYFS